MLLLTGETHKQDVGVLDTDDMIVKYINVFKVIDLIHSGTQFGNLTYNPDSFVGFMRCADKPKFTLIIENTGYNRLRDSYTLLGGVQFRENFFVVNEKYNFACRYIRKNMLDVRLDVLHKGVYHRLETHDFTGFIYNGVAYDSAMNIAKNKISHIGYNVEKRRLELLCTDGLRLERFIFTAKGMRYKNRRTGKYETIESNVQGLDLRGFKRYILME